MGRLYTLSAGDITVGATTLAFLNPPASGIRDIAIRKVEISFKENATSAMQRVQLVRQVTAFPTLTSAEPVPSNERDPVSAIVGGTAGAAGTCGVDASAEGGGAKTVVHEAAFNNLNGWLWVPTDGEEIVLPAGGSSGFGVFFPESPATTDGWSVTVVYEER